MRMREMTIGALAEAGSVGVETVRYYQRRGLLVQPQRAGRGIRRYGEDALARIRFIRRAQQVGFSLDEVATLLRLGEEPGCRGARSLAANKLALIEARLRDLGRMRRALRGLIAQCDAGRARSCPIIESLSGGSTGSRR
jgi:MerR family mercuric resistance operon transcriptional regulator